MGTHMLMKISLLVRHKGAKNPLCCFGLASQLNHNTFGIFLYIFLYTIKTITNPVVSMVQGIFEKSCYFYMYQDKRELHFASQNSVLKTQKRDLQRSLFFIPRSINKFPIQIQSSNIFQKVLQRWNTPLSFNFRNQTGTQTTLLS